MMVLRITQAVVLVGQFFCLGCQSQNRTGAQVVGPGASGPTVIAYYFHRTIRCPMCIAIEANASQSIERNFQQEVTEGRLIWMPVNLEDAESEGFQERFDLSGSALVIAQANDGIHQRHKKLDKVWSLVSDPEALSAYVTEEIRQYLNEQGR